jgi:glutathione synthase/RimK-type ligase-like ATP-grasp enzyme
MTNFDYDVVLLTEPRYEQPADPDWYEAQILREDGYVMEALRERGLRVTRVSWSRPDFDWGRTRLAVFRTTWDYFNRFDEFLPWLERVNTQTRLLNPYELVRWNLNKRYLLDLQARGVSIVPTLGVPRGTEYQLEAAFERWSVPEVIMKPCVGGTARHTHRIRPDTLAEHQPLFNHLVAEEDMLVQPFLPSVMERGEVSVLMFGEQFSHAVLKKAKAGDFRVQDDFGGTVYPHEATEAERQLALQAVLACSTLPAYARVDIMYDLNGQPAISELEMIEPELFFRFRPEAALLLAEAIGGAF